MISIQYEEDFNQQTSGLGKWDHLGFAGICQAGFCSTALVVSVHSTAEIL